MLTATPMVITSAPPRATQMPASSVGSIPETSGGGLMIATRTSTRANGPANQSSAGGIRGS